MEIFYTSLMSAITESLSAVPILFLAYLLVSWLSHDHNHKFYKFLTKSKKGGVAVAAFLGCLPQCGFSSVMADLYTRRKVSLGAMIAVFIATNDETIPMMLAYPDKILSLLLLVGIKIVFAIFWGYLLDMIIGLTTKKKQKNFSVEEEEHEHHSLHHTHECGHIHTDECYEECDEKDHCCVDNVFIDAIMHTFEILIYIFIATFVINLIVNNLNAESLSGLLTNNVYIQILLAALVGLIPNCASSVLLVEVYLGGGLLFPALVAGLTSGAGVGLMVLATKNKKRVKETILIIILQYIIGIISGIILSFIPYLINF